MDICDIGFLPSGTGVPDTETGFEIGIHLRQGMEGRGLEENGVR